MNTYYVDATLVRTSPELWFTLIGEIDYDDEKEVPVLKPRIAVCINGVSRKHFTEALEARRQFLKLEQPF